MNIQLIEGEFSATEALDLITQMIHVKIKYHENKINTNTSEEGIKARENKIKRLQKELYELRNQINATDKNLKLKASIQID